MIVLALLTGGGLAALGFAAGRFLPGRRRGPKPVKLICGCKHQYSYHDPETGHCHRFIDGPGTPIRDKNNQPVKDYNGFVQKIYEQVQCPCRRYTGPEPLPELVARAIAP